MKLALAQINLKAGDIRGNLAACVSAYSEAENAGADLVVFPELTLTGYPPEDLIFKEAFLHEVDEAIQHFAKHTSETAALIGLPYMQPLYLKPYNTAALCYRRNVDYLYFKQQLPNYGVFDEARYFEPGRNNATFVFKGRTIGVSICEDMWVTPNPSPIEQVEQLGADLLINMSASPFSSHRHVTRQKIVGDIARQCNVPMAYCNLVGGQDELVFDGTSFVCDNEGHVFARAKSFAEDLLIVDLDADPLEQRKEKVSVGPWEVYRALVLGTHDYVQKNGFEHVVIGLSGGIDSALVAAVAVDALGAENVTGVMMPSRYSSSGSTSDARKLAENLGIDTYTVSIEDLHRSYEAALQPIFGPAANPGVAEENIQSRIRGNLLMALSNKYDWMVLTTGNKSEMAMGYATLYGDMAGGFAVIKDVPKTMVFEICRMLNNHKGYSHIPQQIIDKAPSAELRKGQRDTDSLPPYELLDPIIEMYVEEDASIEDIVWHGHDKRTVQQVIKAIDRNEYKRRQAPPGVRVTPKAFGKDRRLPITNGWTG